jgi:hypothetical protein
MANQIVIDLLKKFLFKSCKQSLSFSILILFQMLHRLGMSIEEIDRLLVIIAN